MERLVKVIQWESMIGTVLFFLFRTYIYIKLDLMSASPYELTQERVFFHDYSTIIYLYFFLQLPLLIALHKRPKLMIAFIFLWGLAFYIGSGIAFIAKP
ncbi:hypothetical protein [Zooshikella harenae]|uniref:Uncharacterized protein n=1 Tax=Zooshikella harenae TaxID=2827238 RepID=A0ABS5ZKV9_9GAMM|nr:hypothetical protein [Zooshikella harenae]MBU2713941.1 hypothetical protein [Zooshikella harenae]